MRLFSNLKVDIKEDLKSPFKSEESILEIKQSASSSEGIELEDEQSDRESEEIKFPPASLFSNLKTGINPKDYISKDPFETPLRSEGLLYDFEHFNDLEGYFAPFMLALQQNVKKATRPGYSLDSMLHMVEFILLIGERVIPMYPQHKDSISDYSECAKSLYELAKSEQSKAHREIAERISTWRIQMNDLSIDNDDLSQETKKVSNSSFSNSKDDSESMSDSKSKESEGSRLSRKKKSSKKSSSYETGSERRRRRRRRSLSSFSDDSRYSDESSTDDDKRYRKILKVITKAAKNYSIKDLGMSTNPSERRNKFNTWVIDLKKYSFHSFQDFRIVGWVPSKFK
jgi:hypothetical protein